MSGFERQPDLFPTLEHFYQSERFRISDERLRRTIMSAPTAHEARKIALQNISSQRPDWLEKHESIMLAGVWMQLRQNKRLARDLAKAPTIPDTPYPFRDMYWGNDRPGMSKDRFRKVLKHVRTQFRSGTTRLLICGSRSFGNRFLLHTKLAGLLSALHPDAVLIGGDTGTDEIAEDWAIERCLAVRHLLYRGKQTTAETVRHHKALVGSATHIVVVDQGDASSRLFIELALEAGCKHKVIRVSESGALVRSQ